MLLLNNKTNALNKFVGVTKTEQDLGVPKKQFSFNIATGKKFKANLNSNVREFGSKRDASEVTLNQKRDYWRQINRGVPKYFVSTDRETLTEFQKLRTHLLPEYKRKKIIGMGYKNTGIGFQTVVSENLFVESKQPVNKNFISRINSNTSPKRLINKTGFLTRRENYPLNQTLMDKDLNLLPEKINPLESINLKQSSVFPFHKKARFQEKIGNRLPIKNKEVGKNYFEEPFTLSKTSVIATDKVVDEQTKPNDLTLIGVLGALYYILI